MQKNDKTNTSLYPVDVILGYYDLYYDTLCAKYHSESEDTSRLLTLPVTDLSNVKLTYIESSNSDGSETFLDWVQQADISEDKKADIIGVIVQEQEYVAGDYTVFGGSCLYEDEGDSDSQCYHLFDNDKRYIGTVVEKTPEQLSEAENVKSISFYHVVAQRTAENNDYTDAFSYVENRSDISIKEDDIVNFPVSDEYPISFMNIALKNAAQINDSTYDEFGFILSVSRMKTDSTEPVAQMVVNDFDSETGTYKAAHGSEYSSLRKVVSSDEEWEDEEEEIIDSEKCEELSTASDECLISLPQTDDCSVVQVNEMEPSSNEEELATENETEPGTEENIVLCAFEPENEPLSVTDFALSEENTDLEVAA